ncbi:MAG TPA: AAA family ATPase, partial [Micromonosporaceae bacterium]
MLLEREEPATMLASALARVRDSGVGEVVTVAGEAGIGKTALLREFTAGIGAAARILRGGCDAMRTPRPLGPLFDLAPAAGPALQDALIGGAPREVIFAAAVAALRPCGRPTVMIVEDLHWADEATLDLIGFLGRRIGETGALLLLSYRDDQLDPTHGLRVVVGEMVGVIGDRIALRPLTLPSVAALAAPSGLDPAELYRRTGGNPFYVTECLAAGRGAGSWPRGTAAPSTDAAVPAIPRSVRDAVLARASHLSAPARRTLEACSISPGQIEMWLLESMIGADDLRHVDECVDG